MQQLCAYYSGSIVKLQQVWEIAFCCTLLPLTTHGCLDRDRAGGVKLGT